MRTIGQGRGPSQEPSRTDQQNYLENFFDAVPGMSSKTAARICVEVLTIQAERGWYGDVAEIGAFEGRFVVALGLAAKPGDVVFAVDTFSWPDDAVRSRLERRLVQFGLDKRIKIIKASSADLKSADLVNPSGPRGLRFLHVDGDHTPDALLSDLSLGIDTLEPWGVFCLDDMLSPAYPELSITVRTVLLDRGWRVFCIIDRDDIVAASKFLICRAAAAPFYSNALALRFPGMIWPMGAQFEDHRALVLASKPRFIRFGVGGGMFEA